MPGAHAFRGRYVHSERRRRMCRVPGGSARTRTAADRCALPFNRKTKFDLGWAVIGLIDGGRIKEYVDDADMTRNYRHQLAACTYEVLPGPGKLLRWSVPASRGYDDLLISEGCP